jgi:maltooligosyltrehalose trehalohydrolase
LLLPVLTSRINTSTPWGSAINFDDEWCDGVRRYFIENALMWLRDFGIDGLRLDAVHAIKDNSTRHFLTDLSVSVERLNGQTGKNHFLIGECDLNDVRYITPSGKGGMGLNAQWCDEFHHALHALLTGENNGYYTDFGSLSCMTDSFNNAWVYNGKFSEYRKRIFGSSTAGIPGSRFVVFTQNHDQIGNRMLGERLSSLVDYESLKLAAGAIILSPFIPMLFMGEEYGEEAPFLYFTSHGDKKLIEAVREGRKREFADFISGDGPPDPQSANTFKRSLLKWDFLTDNRKKKLLEFYTMLISLKKTHPALRPGSRENVLAVEAAEGKAIILTIAPGQPYGTEGENETRPAGKLKQTADAEPGSRLEDRTGENQAKLTVIMNFADTYLELPFAADSKSLCSVLFYSSHQQWGGPVNDFASLTVNDDCISMEPASIIVFSDFQD